MYYLIFNNNLNIQINFELNWLWRMSTLLNPRASVVVFVGQATSLFVPTGVGMIQGCYSSELKSYMYPYSQGTGVAKFISEKGEM